MKNKINFLSIMLFSVLLAGCANEADDLSKWMGQEQKKIKGKIEPLPEAKEYVPVKYSVNLNPFQIREEITLQDLENMKYAPDPNRKKEPLEFIPLETMVMTGFLIKENKPVGIVKTNDGIFHYVELGNYLGVNHGKITKINEGSIIFEERIQNGDAWVLQENMIELYEETEKRR